MQRKLFFSDYRVPSIDRSHHPWRNLCLRIEQLGAYSTFHDHLHVYPSSFLRARELWTCCLRQMESNRMIDQIHIRRQAALSRPCIALYGSPLNNSAMIDKQQLDFKRQPYHMDAAVFYMTSKQLLLRWPSRPQSPTGG